MPEDKTVPRAAPRLRPGRVIRPLQTRKRALLAPFGQTIDIGERPCGMEQVVLHGFGYVPIVVVSARNTVVLELAPSRHPREDLLDPRILVGLIHVECPNSIVEAAPHEVRKMICLFIR